MTRKSGHTDEPGKGGEKTLKAKQQQFCDHFKRLDGNIKKLSDELGQSYDTVYRRCHRLGLTKVIKKNAATAGKTMAIIDHVVKQVKSKKKRAINTAPVENLPSKRQVIDTTSELRAAGFREAKEGFDIFDALEKEYQRVVYLTAWLEEDLKQQKASGKKVTGYHIDIACKLVRETRATVAELHKIRQEQYTVHGTKMFMEAVTSLLMEELPNVQERLYIKLARLGASPSATFTNAGKQSSTERGTDRISDADIGEELPE